MRDCLRVFYSNHVGFEDDRATAVARERGRINQEGVLVSSDPILNPGDDSVSDDGVAPGVTHQTEGEANQEYAIALHRLDSFGEASPDFSYQ